MSASLYGEHSLNFTWNYPLYIVPHGPGYVSLVDPNVGPSTQWLAVYTNESLAQKLMYQYQVLGSPRPLENAREFAWLVRSLKPPVTQVAFDPQPTDESINAAWKVSCRELLDDHLSIDYSPWNYPVFVIANDDGFVSIEERQADGAGQVALAVFTSEDRVSQYLQASGEAGTPCRLANVDEATRFFTGVSTLVDAVALDPQVSEGERTAKYCFRIDKLLTDYLVNVPQRDGSP